MGRGAMTDPERVRRPLALCTVLLCLSLTSRAAFPDTGIPSVPDNAPGIWVRIHAENELTRPDEGRIYLCANARGRRGEEGVRRAALSVQFDRLHPDSAEEPVRLRIVSSATPPVVFAGVEPSSYADLSFDMRDATLETIAEDVNGGFEIVPLLREPETGEFSVRCGLPLSGTVFTVGMEVDEDQGREWSPQSMWGPVTRSPAETERLIEELRSSPSGSVFADFTPGDRWQWTMAGESPFARFAKTREWIDDTAARPRGLAWYSYGIPFELLSATRTLRFRPSSALHVFQRGRIRLRAVPEVPKDMFLSTVSAKFHWPNILFRADVGGVLPPSTSSFGLSLASLGFSFSVPSVRKESLVRTWAVLDTGNERQSMGEFRKGRSRWWPPFGSPCPRVLEYSPRTYNKPFGPVGGNGIPFAALVYANTEDPRDAGSIVVEVSGPGVAAGMERLWIGRADRVGN